MLYFITFRHMKKISLLLIAIIGTIILTGCGKTTTTTTTTETGSMDTFAQCLNKAGAKMYGTATCSHCMAQKALFGDSFKNINYVDCIVAPTMCSNIANVPTWSYADGSTTQGVQSLEALAKKTNCDLPK